MIDEIADIRNLRRAWRWVRSNSDAQYKWYFRDLYSVYAAASESLLQSLSGDIRRGRFQPSHACKLFIPKKSGILRPYTLLSVSDQIAYQAAVNLVAERMYKHVLPRYYKEVFGHLYAGKSSTWFYRKWQKGHRAFNDAARSAFDRGYRIAASFDLTACYDSLDHGVLCYFLENKFKCDREFCELLTGWLSHWTATETRIYHHHGIPQGPLPSGLLAEAVLQHFDQNRRHEGSVCYLRYVDDIRLFAKREDQLRKMLVRLDHLSKDLGLFPQSGKISIHEVTDIDDELKSISHPVEEAARYGFADQELIRQRLAELSPYTRKKRCYVVKDVTRFKYVLAHAEPEASLTQRLWRIHEDSPELYAAFVRYLQRYRRLPVGAGKPLVDVIKTVPLYPTIHAAFIEAARGRLRARQARSVDIVAEKLWKPTTLQGDLLTSIARWRMSRGKLTYSQMKYAIRRAGSWWARAQVALFLSEEVIGRPSFETLLNHALRDKSSDVAMAAAFVMGQTGASVSSPRRDIHPSANPILKELGLIKRARSRPCGVHTSLERIAGTIATVNWRHFFGSNYADAERHAVECAAFAETNITAWVNAMDVFDDWLLTSLYAHVPGLGKYTTGKIGSIMSSTRLQRSYPKTHAMVKAIHDKRRESLLSHPKDFGTGKTTRPIKYRFFTKMKPIIREAIAELAATP